MDWMTPQIAIGNYRDVEIVFSDVVTGGRLSARDE